MTKAQAWVAIALGVISLVTIIASGLWASYSALSPIGQDVEIIKVKLSTLAELLAAQVSQNSTFHAQEEERIRHLERCVDKMPDSDKCPQR